jgi:cobalt-precorrin 5A hydrolase
MLDCCESGRVFVYAVREEGMRVGRALYEARLDAAEVVVRFGGEGIGAAKFREVYASARSGDVVVFVGACGIAVRFLDGILLDKRTDPAVLVLDEAARHCVVLAGGHEGGGNAMAYRIAEVTGAVPVVTTATEVRKPLVLGVGCRRGVELEAFAECFEAACRSFGVRRDQVREVVTVDVKRDEAGLRRWVSECGFPLRIIGLRELRYRPWVIERSEWVGKTLGVAGVSEACALAVSPRSILLGRRQVRRGVTMAFARDSSALWSDV